MNLIDQIKVSLSPLQMEKVQMIDNFDYSNVAKKVQEEFGISLTDRYISEGIENLKRYYVVALLDPTNQHAVSEVVDPFWHVHVLFTKEYTEFCQSVYGQYIHHAPLDRENEGMVNHLKQLYNYTVNIYHEMFHQVDSSWWPDLGVHGAKEVCRHMEIYNEDIRSQSKFPTKPELKYVS
jgi:hypothetical protein